MKYNRDEWNQEAMNNQSSMFDGQEPISRKMWRKLAMNLLYARPSKSILTNYDENSNEIRKRDMLAMEP